MSLLFTAIGSQISVLDVCVRIIMSIIIGTIIGYERERKNRPAGLRTHVLVCMTSSLIAMTEQQMIYEINNLSSAVINLSFGRLSVGVITGIGFIGAGTIMMSKSKIVGLTTAASLWCIACLGLINGIGYSVVAFIASIIVVSVLQLLRIGERTSLNRIIEVEYLDVNDTGKKIEEFFIENNVKVNDTTVAFHIKEEGKICTIRFSIVFKDKKEIIDIMSALSDIENVREVKHQSVM